VGLAATKGRLTLFYYNIGHLSGSDFGVIPIAAGIAAPGEIAALATVAATLDIQKKSVSKRALVTSWKHFRVADRGPGVC
jgi:hypothetical protein